MWNVSEQLASKESQNVVGLSMESHLVVDTKWSGQNCAPRASAIL